MKFFLGDKDSFGFNHTSKNRCDGFTIIEVLIATFVVGVIMVGLFGFFVLSLRLAQEGERRVVAVALANEKAEMIRNLPYVDVGTAGGIPLGVILQEEEIMRNDVPYTVKVDIRYVDDPYDGVAGGGGSGGCLQVSHDPPGNPGNCRDLCVPSSAVNAHLAHGDIVGQFCDGTPAGGPDVLNTDYKQVRLEVTWPSPQEPKPVLLIMMVVPPGIEGGELFGTLDFQALDTQGMGVEGAAVTIVNTTTDPTVDVATQTNSEGRVVLPGLPAAAQSYVITVGKTGYTSEQTYDATAIFFPDPDHSHLSSIIGEVTQKTFFIDLAARLGVTIGYPQNRAALNFDTGVGDADVEVNHDASYELSSGTISFWFKADSVAGGRQGLVTKDAAGYGSGGHVSIELNGASLDVHQQSGTNTNTLQFSGIEARQWYHAAYTFGSAGMKFYLNGGVPATNSYTGGWQNNQEPMGIGAATGESGAGVIGPVNDGFAGLIDDIRIYNRELSDGEVQTLANDGKGTSDGLVGYWGLDEEAAPAVDSVSGNNGAWNNNVVRSWDTAWLGGVGEVLSGVGYALQGTKLIGLDDLGESVYLVDENVTTDVNGQNEHINLVWDAYALIIDGAVEGYDIRSTNQLLPLTLNPGDDVEVEMLLVDHTDISLHVSVTDVSGAALGDVTIRLIGTGVDETLLTRADGQVLFTDLPDVKDYVLELEAAGYETQSTTVDVEGTFFATVEMIAI